ncbi:hypothetical protein EDI_237830 [Entamoeba dispar SAW760]|uniref:START domain-containing protein n=1 Tax=Entamoeba dispar (strain ATCC PRA-260 / SAW760) TaxID=370354 RepID=B0E895_ENTDS|nr:uncharacterized protein EDI_237830 [Entamoeba dispar SAW760]EDR29220.1 hypothetical protein EDI_237830 [Entamoeba dispar SAW760]|eukprot:EDR29220.1 hypothetical protein EDI_237830 [Entamoeba dispar SAW760]
MNENENQQKEYLKLKETIKEEENSKEILKEEEIIITNSENTEINLLEKEEKNNKRIKEIEKIKKKLNYNDLDDIMKTLRKKERESQNKNMFIPYIQNKDFAGILLMDEASDPRYLYSNSSGVDIWRRKVNGSTWNGVARTIIPNISPKKMSELYWDYTKRKKWDNFYTVIEDLEILENGNRVSRTATWTPKMFKQRDYIHVREVIETENCCIGVYLPAEHKKAPIGLKGFIRGYVNFSGFVFRKQGKDCLCTLMTQTDISVPLPDFIINKFVALAVRLYVKLMKKAGLEYGKEET